MTADDLRDAILRTLRTTRTPLSAHGLAAAIGHGLTADDCWRAAWRLVEALELSAVGGGEREIGEVRFVMRRGRR